MIEGNIIANKPEKGIVWDYVRMLHPLGHKIIAVPLQFITLNFHEQPYSLDFLIVTSAPGHSGRPQ